MLFAFIISTRRWLCDELTVFMMSEHFWAFLQAPVLITLFLVFRVQGRDKVMMPLNIVLGKGHELELVSQCRIWPNTWIYSLLYCSSINLNLGTVMLHFPIFISFCPHPILWLFFFLFLLKWQWNRMERWLAKYCALSLMHVCLSVGEIGWCGTYWLL